MFTSNQLGCTSISQVVQLLENRVVCGGPHQCRICPASKVINMGAFHLRVFGISTTAVLELFSLGWIEINEYLDK